MKKEQTGEMGRCLCGVLIDTHHRDGGHCVHCGCYIAPWSERMAGKKCLPGCTCKRHQNGPKLCRPGCDCYKHFWSQEQRQAKSDQMLLMWQDPEYREQLVEAHTGKRASEETRRLLSEMRMGHATSEETRQKISTGRRGKRNGGEPAAGQFLKYGYRILTGQQEHPLSLSDGTLAEHRKVLYDKIGPGSHPCHWCDWELAWGGVDGICVDHLDTDRLNNNPENLVPSCHDCNKFRGRRLS